MNVQVKSFQGMRPLGTPVGLSDPLKAVEAITLLRGAQAYDFQTGSDFDVLAQMRMKLRKTQISPMFDTAVNRNLANRAFWVSAVSPEGNTVALQAFRLDDADPNLAEWALGWMMGQYAKRQELVIPGAPHVPDHSATMLISGPIAYHGELWIDNQHKGIFENFTRTGMLLAMLKWQPEALWCLGSKAMATRGHFVRSGYVHIERSFLRWNWEPSGAEQVEWIGIAERRHLEFMISEMTSKESRHQLSSLR